MIPENPGKLGIVCFPHPVLREVCEPVQDFGPQLQALVDRMIELIHAGEGVGLAAPQVGLPLRLFVCNANSEPGEDRVYINPVLSELTGAEEHEEGCLSLPGVNVMMRRATGARIEACDTKGRPFTANAEDLLARIWQHETDHLSGRLITDNMSETDEIANRPAIKQLKEGFVRSR